MRHMCIFEIFLNLSCVIMVLLLLLVCCGVRGRALVSNTCIRGFEPQRFKIYKLYLCIKRLTIINSSNFISEFFKSNSTICSKNNKYCSAGCESY